MRTYQWIVAVILAICGTTGLRSSSLPELREILDAQKGKDVIQIPRDTYMLDLTKGAYTFSSLKNVRVEGNGSLIICNAQNRAFNISNCEDFVLADLAIDYNPLCFTQGTITEIAGDNSWWDIEIHPGYPVENVTNRKVQVFDKHTCELKENFYTIYSSDFGLEKTGERTFRITKNRSLYPVSEEVGDYVVLEVVMPGYPAPHTIYSDNCKNLVFENIIIYGSNSFSMLESDCENSRYSHCILTRRTDDPKVGFPRLRAGNVDGIHSKHAVRGPVIENCTIEYIADDCIAINGNFYPVYATDKENGWIYVLSAETGGNIKIQMNDSIVCIGNDGVSQGTAKAGLMRSSDPDPVQRQACLHSFSQGVNNADAYVHGTRIKIDPWIEGVKAGDVFYSKNRTGNGFRIENNKVGHTRARGILVKASEGVIRNNEIDYCELGGIVLSPEIYWMEAGCPSDVEVSFNTIRNCLFAASNPGISHAGSISLISINAKNSISAAGAFRNISIHDNLVEGGPRPAVVLTSAQGIRFYNNTFLPDLSMLRTHGQRFGITNREDVWMEHVEELTTPLQHIQPVTACRVEVNNREIFISSPDLQEIDSVKVYNLLGTRLVEHHPVDTTCHLSLFSLPAGWYILQIHYGNCNETYKILLK